MAGKALIAGDEITLFSNAATAAVRHPTVEAVAADHLNRQGLPAPHGDQVQYLRVAALRNQLPEIPKWRWRVLHAPDDGPRFMITDRGWMYVGEPDWPSHGLFLPMGPGVALLGYLHDPNLPPARSAFEEHFDLCQSWIEWFNAAAWDDPFRTVLIAHPDDRDCLMRLPGHRDLRVNGLGPFRHRQTRGLFG